MGDYLSAVYSFIRKPSKEKLLLLQLCYILVEVKIVINIFSLSSYYDKYLSNPVTMDINLKEYAFRINQVIKVQRLVPWKSTCLYQSICIKLFLRKFGIEIPIFIGVNTSQELSAHAWVIEKHRRGYKNNIPIG